MSNRGDEWTPERGPSPAQGQQEDAAADPHEDDRAAPVLLMPTVAQQEMAQPQPANASAASSAPPSRRSTAPVAIGPNAVAGAGDEPESDADDDRDDGSDRSPREEALSPTNTMSTPGAFLDRSGVLAMDDAERRAAHDSKYEYSLNLFGPKNPIRVGCCIIMRSVAFRWFIMLCILVNGALLAVDEPGRDKDDALIQALFILDLVFFAIFALEMLIKIIALGFFMHKGAYLRDRWNVLDALIVVASAIAIIAGSATNVSTLRVFRVLRPLRSIQRVKELKTLITALFDAIPEVANNLLLFLFVLILFGISGVVLFAGDLTFRCYATELVGEVPPRPPNETWTNVSTPFLLLNDEEICGGTRRCPNITGEYGVRSNCESHRDLYYRRNLNFDHLLSGGLLTLKVMTMDDWHEDLADVMNARGQATSLWFVVLTFVGAFVVVNLFLAILTQTYHNRVVENAKEDATTQVTDEALDETYANLRIDLLEQTQVEMENPDIEAEAASPIPNPLAPPGSKARHGATNVGPAATPLAEGSLESAPGGRSHTKSGRTGSNQNKRSTAASAGALLLAMPELAGGVAEGTGDAASPRKRSVTASGAIGGSVTASHVGAGAVEPAGTVGALGTRSALKSGGGKPPLPPAPSRKEPPPPSGGATAVAMSPTNKPIDPTAAGGILSAEEMRKRRVDMQLKRLRQTEAADKRMKNRIKRGVTRGDYAFEAGVIAKEAEEAEDDDDDDAVDDGGGWCAGMTCSRLWGFDDGSMIVEEDDDDRPPWRRRLAAVMDSIGMQTVITIVTLVNVITLAIDYHGIDPELLAAMDMVSVVCTAIYIVNLALTVVGEGFYRTFRNGFNVLDFLIILISVPDIIFTDGEGSAWGVFRIFRLLRLLRFLRIKRLQPIVRTIMDSVTSIGYLSLLILLFLYIFSVTGMQVFGTDFASDAPEERNRFGTIWQASITTFIAITGENWTALMRVGMQSYSNGLEIIPVAFFVIVYLFGNYILINLSVAIILDTLESKLADLDGSGKEEISPPLLLLPRYIPPKKAKLNDSRKNSLSEPNSPTSPAVTKPRRTTFAVDDAPSSRPGLQRKASAHPTFKGVPEVVPGPVLDPADLEGQTSDTQNPPASPIVHSSNASTADGPVLFADAIREKASSIATKCQRVKEYLTFVRPIIVEEKSFFVFRPDNCLRKAMVTVSGSNLFDRFIDFVIVVNMFFLLFESPNNSDEFTATLRAADYAFTAVFFIEMLIKMIAFGAVMPESDRSQKGTGYAVQEGYFRDYWNWIDFLVVALSIAAYFMPPLRASRALRALRLMTRFETTKIIVVAVLEAIPHVLQTLVFVAFVFFVLGVMGVKFFKGRYYRCNDSTIIDRADCVGLFNDTIQGPIFKETVLAPREWTREAFHFDHLGSALLTLFVVTCGDGWSDIMFNGMDTSDEENVAMQHGNRDYMSIFFVITFITCNFFALNMMIGVLVSYFAKKKRLHDGSSLLTPSQRMYVKARYAIDATVVDYQVPRNDSKAAAVVDKILTYRHPKISEETSIFDLVMMMVIIVNTVMIASTHDGMSDTQAQAIDITSNVALGIFILEMCLKLFAYGLFQYASVGWNVFDAIIVFMGLLGIIVQQRGLSVFRVLRVFKMIKGTGVERLLISLFRGVSSFINITGILALTFFIFAVAGVILFGEVKLQGAITINYNFRTVPNAMLTLYTVATGSGWAEVMDACGVEPPKCEPELHNCGNLPASVAFFVSFMIVCSFIVLQLFVAVVVEIFLDDVNFNDPVIVAFATMRQQWVDRFGASTQSASAEDLADLLRELPPILTDFTFEATRADVIRLMGTMNVPVDSHFHALYPDIVHALAFRKFKVDLRSMAKYVNDAVVTVFGTRAFTATQAYCILVIQRAWRKRKAFLAAPVQPLTGISTVAWMQRVVERRARKAERSTASSDSMNLRNPADPAPLESFSQKSVTTFVPRGGIAVPGSTMYAFPMADAGGALNATMRATSAASMGGEMADEFGIQLKKGDLGSPMSTSNQGSPGAGVSDGGRKSVSFERVLPPRERRRGGDDDDVDDDDDAALGPGGTTTDTSTTQGGRYTGAAATSDGGWTEGGPAAQSFDERSATDRPAGPRRQVSFAPAPNVHDEGPLTIG